VWSGGIKEVGVRCQGDAVLRTVDHVVKRGDRLGPLVKADTTHLPERGGHSFSTKPIWREAFLRLRASLR